MQSNAGEVIMESSVIEDMEHTEAVASDNITCITQDNSPSLFVYWDERVRTTLSEFHEYNRQPSRVSIILLRYSPPLYKCITDLGNAKFSYAEYPSSVTENYIVTLRKFRI